MEFMLNKKKIEIEVSYEQSNLYNFRFILDEDEYSGRIEYPLDASGEIEIDWDWDCEIPEYLNCEETENTIVDAVHNCFVEEHKNENIL